MSTSRKLLLLGGLALAGFGMLYGLHYALFVEHQTLDQMGASLAEAFSQAAVRQMGGADTAIDSYAATKYKYVRQVDVHSHWVGLAMLLIVMGVVFDSVAFTERIRIWIAGGLLGGAVLFPLGVILQTFIHRSALASALAVAGSGLVTMALAAAAWGFSRASS
jgi:hypothetical protein